MTRDPLQRLVQFIATETNPHQLVLRVVSEASVLEEARRLCQNLPSAASAGDGRIVETCRLSKIPLEFFWERLQLLARILNLIPYDQNYYEILGVEHRASQHEIKQAFRRLSFACHPDTNPHDPNAAERFRTLQHAYQVLSHDLLRQRYDHNQEEHYWEEPDKGEGRIGGLAWWGKWRRIWPVALLIVLLMGTIFVVDYSQWQTERYYAGVGKRYAGVEPTVPLRPTNAPANPVPDKPSPAAPPSEAPATEPEELTPPESPPQEASNQSPVAAAKQAVSSEMQDGTPAKMALSGQTERTPRAGETTSGNGSESRPAAPPQKVADAAKRESPREPAPPSAPQATIPKPLEKPSPRAAGTEPPPATAGKEQERRQRADARQEGPTPASGVRQRDPSSAAATHSPTTDGFTRLENLDREIRTFLTRYTSTYEARDMNAFLRLFEANAIENGVPVQELVPLYQANFKRAEKLRYRINLGRWEVGQGEVMVDGSFTLAVQFEREAPVESTGTIQLTLVRRAGDFGVKRLNYSFKESRKTAQ